MRPDLRNPPGGLRGDDLQGNQTCSISTTPSVTPHNQLQTLAGGSARHFALSCRRECGIVLATRG
ncbi:MAG: hypothetical protein EH225_11660 [Calditrichaeota bacterium]|nr:MAG: hypothetical protein EH225_11660 [Calditrichota bacterium]